MRRKKRHVFGERCASAKITESDVRAIRASTDTLQACADRHGISAGMVSRIRRRLDWKHVDDILKASEAA